MGVCLRCWIAVSLAARAWSWSTSSPWIESRIFVGKTPLQAFDSDNEMSQQQRMEIVRSLQTSFYQTARATVELDPYTGILSNLPLWQMPWHELPGRTNVLFVHEPVYTNMFETVLRSEKPHYVGHLYRRNQQSPLAPWWSIKQPGDKEDASAVLGTLLRITDYRRMSDGRLLVLVQAVERFVVTAVHQTLPYSIANVQLLPDVEELYMAAPGCRDRILSSRLHETTAVTARATAIQESWEKWYLYEFEDTALPLPSQSEMPMEQVVASSLAQILPYAPFSSVVDVATLTARDMAQSPVRQQQLLPRTVSTSSSLFETFATPPIDKNASSLEYRLLCAGILQQPPLSPTMETSLEHLTADELEIRLWLALNDFLKSTRKAVSPHLLGLLPHLPNKTRHYWPKDFVLLGIGNAIAQTAGSIRVSKHYPAHRRQKRLSFSAAALLEQPDSFLREQLLAIPSTKTRLAFVLQLVLDELKDFQ
jgi:Lon protease-like protein